MAVVASVVLNAIFLAGTWRYSQLRLGGDGSPLSAGTFNDFFVNQAKEWRIPEEDVKRVRSVVDEAIELVAVNAQGPVEIRLSSDSFDVRVTLSYTGNLPPCRMPAQSGKWLKNKASSAGSQDTYPGCMPTGSSAVRKAKLVRSDSSSVFS